ncbi:hypothetical protein BG004_002239 [Podila humilis]|nr:hypothetical protein BG004_002239 [Podila humilis]
MLPGLKAYFDNSAARDISLVSFMRQFPDIQEKDRIISTWTGSLSYLLQHSTSEKRQLYTTLSKYTPEELIRIVDDELQEREHDRTLVSIVSRQELAASRSHTKQVEKRFNDGMLHFQRSSAVLFSHDDEDDQFQVQDAYKVLEGQTKAPAQGKASRKASSSKKRDREDEMKANNGEHRLGHGTSMSALVDLDAPDGMPPTQGPRKANTAGRISQVREDERGDSLVVQSNRAVLETTMAAYALFNQRVDWDDEIVDKFNQYTDEHQGQSDIGEDYIMDITAGSSLVKSFPDDVYNMVMADAPTLPRNFPELEELKELIGDKSTFLSLQELVYNVPLNTKVRRFVYAGVQGYSKYFPRNTHLPDKDERQLMIDIIDPVLQGALDVFDISRDVSEIAILGSGERRNYVKNPTEKIDRCKRADFVGYDNGDRQLLLAECSTMYETDARKLLADRWKLSRAMKDTFDSTMKKCAERVQPHSQFSVFGLQLSGRSSPFFKWIFAVFIASGS